MKLSSINGKISSILALPLFVVAIMSWTGCEKDYNYVAPPASNNGGGGGGGGSTPTVFYGTDIQPIFTSRCAVAGCHSGSVAPNLSEGSSYSEVSPFVNTAEPSSSDLYRRITLPSSDVEFMPEGQAPLTDDQKAKILTWITEGAHNN